MPFLFSRLRQAGWDTESAGALSVGDESARVALVPATSDSLRVQPGAEGATAAELPPVGAAANRGASLLPIPGPAAENVPRRRRQRAGSKAESLLLRASS
jgi:hypothetical protein